MIRTSNSFMSLMTVTTIIIFALGCNFETEMVVKTGTDTRGNAPKLMIGITIDQMRSDYLIRYSPHFSKGGFLRIQEDGFTCYDHHFGYAPTYTGPGHASIFTGTTPAIHGIVANDWYVRELKSSVYCTSDDSVFGVGVNGIDEDGTVFGLSGKMSPRRMLTSTIGDELKLSTGMKAKVIGISLKDRGAILPAGHAADGAYWFYGMDKGHFITSTYYGEEMTDWAKEFNKKTEVESLINLGWELLYEPDTYEACWPDNNPYEGPFVGALKATFPYDLSVLKEKNGGFDILKGTPGGNTILVDFALAAIEGEGLGVDDITDMLTVSFSATDYVGHRCGSHAMETMDMYLRLDLELERFFHALDEKVGKGNWTVFVTADHGGATVPSLGASEGLPTGYWSHGNMQERIEQALDLRYGNQESDWIENVSNNSIFISESASSGIDKAMLQRFIADLALEEDGILQSIPLVDLATRAAVDPFAEKIYSGHMQGVSGDVLLVMKPGWLTYGKTGTSHGSPYAYDTHVPCIFYGSGVNYGYTHSPTYIRDIAPTVAALLGAPYPNGTTGAPIYHLLD
jgi:predicted AlkP superfamily pyrophosphatase or phosphodiesterase